MLEQQANVLLAAQMAAEAEKTGKPGKKSEKGVEESAAVMTDEEAKKAGVLRLDDKQAAAGSAARSLSASARPAQIVIAKNSRPSVIIAGQNAVGASRTVMMVATTIDPAARRVGNSGQTMGPFADNCSAMLSATIEPP